MISDAHECIFVHLRRTGGNSIECSLGGIVLLDRNMQRTTVWDNSLHRGKSAHKLDFRGHDVHATALEIRRQFPEKFERYSKFSVVRNPWDQMVSLYLRLDYKTKPSTFAGWLRTYKRMEGTVPERSLFDIHRRCLVDEIGRFENLASDYAEICEKFGIQAEPLYKMNSSQPTDYTTYYDRATRDLVREMFNRDIKYFGFRFGE